MLRTFPERDCGTAGDAGVGGRDVTDVGLLLPLGQAAALAEAAHRLGLTAGEMVRRLIGDFLRRQRLEAHAAGNEDPEPVFSPCEARSWPRPAS
jgi:hypothetical protein